MIRSGAVATLADTCTGSQSTVKRKDESCNDVTHATGTDDDADDDDGQPKDLFDEAIDPLTLLEGMGRQLEGNDAAQQPYEVLARSQWARQHSTSAATCQDEKVSTIWSLTTP